MALSRGLCENARRLEVPIDCRGKEETILNSSEKFTYNCQNKSIHSSLRIIKEYLKFLFTCKMCKILSVEDVFSREVREIIKFLLFYQ